MNEYETWGERELIARIEELESNVDDYIEVLDQNISVESSKDLSGEWTEEYRAGYVDGLKRAKELLNNKN